MFLRGEDKHGREAEKNLDLRIRKTRRAIRSGLVKACQAKPYAHVSVTDICSASMVSRTTFYDHYTDKDALLAEVVSFLLAEITPALEGELPPVSWTSKLKSKKREAFRVCGSAVEA